MNEITDYDLFYEPKKTIAVVSGYFDMCGLHHVNLFKAAKELRQNTYLIVGINSDEACARKKGQPAFLDWDVKSGLIQAIRYVDEVLDFNDDDNSACDLLKKVYNRYSTQIDDGNVDIVFCNGGDRISLNIPEESWAKIHYPKIQFAYGVGGDKKTGASSDVLKRWTDNFFQKMNKNRTNFVLEGKELEKAIEFMEHQREDSRSEGCSGGRFSYIFTPTNIGLAVSIRDEITKEECNVTDYSMW